MRSFSYLASGQVSQDARSGSSQTYTFAANDNGRNASAALNGTTAGAYLYNAFEQRVQKTAGAAATQLLFDRFGHLLEEANASGVVQKEYIWLDDLPVAVIDDTGTTPVLYYIQIDQLGTPQKITDGSANVVWDGVFDPFGNAQFLGSGAGVWDTSQWDSFLWGASLALTNLRFPGQYADAETALNQNWFRDYDPTIGRYIQSDPLQAPGWTSNYTFVDSNPMRVIDPIGLQTAVAPLPILPLPPIAVPGTPENTAWVNWVDSLFYNSMSSADPELQAQIEKKANYNQYKSRCSEKAPDGLRNDPCELAKWNLRKAQDCKALRDAFSAKYFGGADDVHDPQLYENIEDQIARAERAVERHCPCPGN